MNRTEDLGLTARDAARERGALRACSLPSADEDGHCVTCSDEALPARVLSIDADAGLASVAIDDVTAEVDVSLVDAVQPGDMLLIHGGVAIDHLGQQ